MKYSFSFILRFGLIYVFCLCAFLNINAQDIEPRRWTTMPLGTHVIGAGYGYTSGEILFDPVLNAEDVTVDIHAFAAVYVQPFKIGKKLGRVDFLLPYATARWDGLLSGVDTTVKRNGLSDPRIRLSVNLIGPNAMGPKEMMQYLKEHPVNTIFGASIAVTLPLGQYDETKLLNLGKNRFVIRPQMGMVHNWGFWSYELTGSVFIYTNNNNFFNDQERKQDPVFAIQTHLIRRFSNKMWVSLSGGYGLGGQSIVNGLQKDDEHGDFLWSLSFGSPITKTQAFKVNFVRYETTRDVGSNTNTIAVSWSKLF
jgi:hypothetical protein